MAIAGKPAPTVTELSQKNWERREPVGVGLPAKNDAPIHLPEHKRHAALAIALTLT
jgi:hypothetical protein